MRSSLVLLLVALPLMVLAQPDTLWTRFMGSEGTGGVCYDVLPVSDGGFVGVITFMSALFLVKLDARGDTVWCNHYPLEQLLNGGYFSRIKATPGNTFTVGGNSGTTPVLAKFDSVGNLSRLYALPSLMGGGVSDFCPTRDGGYFIVATSYNRTVAAKIAAYGDTVWTRVFTDYGYNSIARVLEVDSTHYLLAGTSYTDGAMSHEGIAMTEFDADGDSVWSNLYYQPERRAEFHDLIRAHDSTYVVIAATSNDTTGVYGHMFMKVSLLGDRLYSTEYPNVAWGFFVRENSDGSFIVASESRTLTKLSALGEPLWTRTYTFGTPSYDNILGVHPLTDGGLIACGMRLVTASQPFMVRFAPELTARPFILHPSSFILSSYPNPFNASTEITFELPRAMQATLKVFNLLGEQVSELVNEHLTSGEHRITFDGSGMPSGVYFCRLNAEGVTQTRKLLLLK